ncbi:MAG: hypothetical protein U0T73_08245 [Chitinophagales bacterium]
MLWKICKGVLFALLMIPLFFAFVWGFQWLWNAVIPSIFNFKTITYWQAFGLLVISRILFGGAGFRFQHGGKKRFWRERMRMKMAHMSDAEKEEFKRKVRERCGY